MTELRGEPVANGNGREKTSSCHTAPATLGVCLGRPCQCACGSERLPVRSWRHVVRLRSASGSWESTEHRAASLSCPLSGAGEPPVPLIVLPKSCSCRWGPCPPPPSLVWFFVFSLLTSFFCRAGSDVTRERFGPKNRNRGFTTHHQPFMNQTAPAPFLSR